MRVLGSLSGAAEYSFHTVQVWKGPLFKTFKVVTDGGCGYSFEPGQHYLVYAHVVTNDVVGGAEVLMTSQCMRPQIVDEARRDRGSG